MSRPGPRDEPAPRPQQLLAQALRAQAGGAATRSAGRQRRDLGIAWCLALALLVGALLGVGLALLSVLAPGVLPTIG